MNLTEAVAQYIKKTGTFVSTDEVAKALKKNRRVVAITISNIKRHHRFDTRTIKDGVVALVAVDKIRPPSKSHIPRPVRGVSNRTGFVVEFESVRATERGGFCADLVRASATGKRKFHAGYKWEFVTAENKQ